MIDLFDPVAAEALDYIKVSGLQSPGRCLVTGGAQPRKWDERNGLGLSGATIVFTGLGVAEFTTRILLATSAELAAWHVWKVLVDPPPQGQKEKIQEVYHPLLAEVKISAAGVTNRTQLTPLNDQGEWYVDIMWKGYRKPLPQIGTAAGAKATQYQQTAGDAGSQQVAALLKQLQSL